MGIILGVQWWGLIDHKFSKSTKDKRQRYLSDTLHISISMWHLFFRHLPFIRQSLKRYRKAFTLVELLIVSLIAGTLAAIALPTYTNYMDKARNNQAMADIREMESKIVSYQAEHGAPPDTLNQVESGNRVDPWGKPYEYLRILGVDKDQIKGKWRKDRFLVPVNSDFDLYSMGKDGESKAPFTAKASQDDIIRANNGAYVGLASGF
jgi:general secretion pathway protein G